MPPAVGTAAVVQTPRHCRDCSEQVPGRALYCDAHRDLRRILTFLHQARLVAETSASYDACLGGQIRRVIAKAEALR